MENKINCFDIVNEFMDCKSVSQGNLPYDNFSYGFFKYINKTNPDYYIVFDTLDNEYQTTVQTISKPKNLYENTLFKSRYNAIKYICDTIDSKSREPDEISLIMDYYDDKLCDK